MNFLGRMNWLNLFNWIFWKDVDFLMFDVLLLIFGKDEIFFVSMLNWIDWMNDEIDWIWFIVDWIIFDIINKCVD